MSYDKVLIDYSLLPKKAFPLDARSHFEDFETARENILGRVCVAEDSFLSNNVDKRYYIGQIITTTHNGTWIVCSQVSTTLYLYCSSASKGIFKVAWNAKNENNYIDFYCTSETDLVNIKISIYSYENGPLIGEVTEEYRKVHAGEWLSKTLSIEETNLVPFSGGSSGGGRLVINTDAPLNYDSSNTKLTLSIDETSPLVVENSKLTLSIDNNSPLSVVNNKLTLNIDTTSDLKIVNNKLTLNTVGIHSTVEKNESTENIKINNYIYQEL